jgi:hypothetical protein
VIRNNCGYIMGEEKLRTGAMSEDEFIARALVMTHSKLERVMARNAAQGAFRRCRSRSISSRALKHGSRTRACVIREGGTVSPT